jgi:hypothetical protein
LMNLRNGVVESNILIALENRYINKLINKDTLRYGREKEEFIYINYGYYMLFPIYINIINKNMYRSDCFCLSPTIRIPKIAHIHPFREGEFSELSIHDWRIIKKFKLYRYKYKLFRKWL